MASVVMSLPAGGVTRNGTVGKLEPGDMPVSLLFHTVPAATIHSTIGLVAIETASIATSAAGVTTTTSNAITYSAIARRERTNGIVVSVVIKLF